MIADATVIREQLERILSSQAFANAGRHSRLLKYLVERTLAGDGEQLKEYVLGMEVFDRADSYDPRLDSIVRVEVRRLRSRLEGYYLVEGAPDPVAITIPRGSYVPVFEPRARAVPPEGAGSRTPVDIRAQRFYSPATIIAAALSVAIVLFAAGLVFNTERAPAQASTGPGIAVLPFEHYSTQERDALLVSQITDAVTAELAKLGTLSVASRTSAARYVGGPESVVAISKALNVDFVMEAGVSFTTDGMRVVVRLVDGRLDRKVWVSEYEVERSDVSSRARTIAADAAAAALKYVNR
jgi:TolB-like protein